MSLEQFTYTGSPWGITAPGWTVFQHSSGISPKDAVELKPFFQFKEIDTENASVIDYRTLPIKLTFVNAEKKEYRIICQSLDAGPRWYDQTRGKDYFAHVFVELPVGNDLINVTESFNPMSWFLSSSFQVEFPEIYREKALQILHGERSNEPTPLLPVLSSLTDIEPNFNYVDDQLFSRICGNDNFIRKIGKLAAEMVRRHLSIQTMPLFFDGTKAYSIDAMAAAVRLLPLIMRTKISFCTWLPSGEIKSFPAINNILFAGTFRSGEVADLDIGLYGVVPIDGPTFTSREDIETFKRMVDIAGLNLDVADYNNLVSCWEIASGHNTNRESLCSARLFAKRFQGMSDEIESGLAGVFANYSYEKLPEEFRIVAAIAWFEFGWVSFEDYARQVCSESVNDFSLLEKVLVGLTGNEAKLSFLEEVSQLAAEGEAMDFFEKVMNTDHSLDNYAWQLSEDSLLRLALEYRHIYQHLSQNYFNDDAVKALNIIDKISTYLGQNVEDIEKTRTILEYRHEISLLKTIMNVKSLGTKFPKGFPRNASEVRADILSKVNPESIPQILSLGKILDDLGLNGNEMVIEKWTRDRNINKQVTPTTSRLTNSGKKSFKMRGCLLNILICVICIIIGFLVGKRSRGVKIDYIPSNIHKLHSIDDKTAREEPHRQLNTYNKDSNSESDIKPSVNANEPQTPGMSAPQTKRLGKTFPHLVEDNEDEKDVDGKPRNTQ